MNERGKIEYHTQPPEDTNNYEISSAIITQEVAEFNLEEYDRKIFEEMEEPMDIVTEKKETSVNGMQKHDFLYICFNCEF